MHIRFTVRAARNKTRFNSRVRLFLRNMHTHTYTHTLANETANWMTHDARRHTLLVSRVPALKWIHVYVMLPGIAVVFCFSFCEFVLVIFLSAFCFISRYPNRNVQQQISRVALPSHQLLIPGTVLSARCSPELVFPYPKRCACSMPMYIRYLSRNSKWDSCSSTFLSLDFVNALFIRRKIKRNEKMAFHHHRRRHPEKPLIHMWDLRG